MPVKREHSEAGPSRTTRSTCNRPAKRTRRDANPNVQSTDSRRRSEDTLSDAELAQLLDPYEEDDPPSIHLTSRASFEGHELNDTLHFRSLVVPWTFRHDVEKVIDKSDEECREWAGKRYGACHLISMEAEVVIHEGERDEVEGWRLRKVATFDLVDRHRDNMVIQAMLDFMKSYALATVKRYKIFEVQIFGKYSSKPRTWDTYSETDRRAGNLSEDFRRSFRCEDMTCFNVGNTCIRFQDKHVEVQPREYGGWASSHVRKEKTMATTILEFIIGHIEKEAAKHPGTLEQEDITRAVIQMPFLHQFLPVADIWNHRVAPHQHLTQLFAMRQLFELLLRRNT